MNPFLGRRRRTLAFGIAASALASLGAKSGYGKEGEGPIAIRNSAFSIGLVGVRHVLHTSRREAIQGNGAEIPLGFAWIERSWYLNATYSLILGPYEPVLRGHLTADGAGNGLSLTWGYSVQGLDLRTDAGGYGFAVGLRYLESVTRSTGRDRLAQSDPASGVLLDDMHENFTQRHTSLALAPGLFFAWLKPARPRGNAPDLLMTRMEGQVLSISLAVPVQSRVRTRYDLLRAGEQQDQPREAVDIRDQATGYSMLIELTVFLGV